MLSSARAARRRRLSLALGTSTLAWGLALSPAAHAQCAPDPTAANGITTCTGTDSNGIRVTTPGTTLAVASGASVSNTGAAAITVEVPNTVPTVQESIAVAGQVSGGAQSGIMLLSGPYAAYNGSTVRLKLTIAAGGSVSGSAALTMAQSSGNNYGQLVATIDNAGTLTGSSGVALKGDVATTANGYTTSNSAFDFLTNRAGGTISGSIVGPVASLTNAGVIDGGSGSALTTGNAGAAVPFTIGSGVWTNSGTIRSNSGAATINSATMSSLTNNGSIANAGSGAALSSSFLVTRNQIGGQISSAGATAIAGSNYVNLTNLGTITGNVVTGSSGSTVDSSLGRINGSVIFGSGNDTLVVRYGGTSEPVTGITGTINAGGGTNTEQLAVSTDTTVGTPVTLLAGFQQFGIAIDKGVTTTLGSGFTTSAPIQMTGAGTLVNGAAITTSGTAFVINGAVSPGNGRFVNEGSIQTSSTSAYAVTAGGSGFPQVVNNGSITSAGAGVSSAQASVINNGTITAASTGVYLSNNALTNTGVIRSTGGTGVSLTGNVGIASTNSGTIQGALTGVQADGFLTNTGSITATRSDGTAVAVSVYGALYNNAGGVVGSGGQAVTGGLVVNAGTINGSASVSTFVSQAGGMLNGNLVLGPGATLFTDLAGTGAGQFAGINGTVTAGNGAALRLRVTGAQSATIGPVGPFANPAYELREGANLALTAAGTVTQQVALAGTGSVDLTANLSTTNSAPALVTTSTLSTRPSYAGSASALAITSHGTISATRATGSTSYPGAAIGLGSGDTFTNLGVISVTDRNSPGGTIGISGGSVVNAGTILLDGGVGASGGKLVNTGTITQITGGATAMGVSSGTVDNRGTIRVGGIAVNGGTVTNSGVIASTGGIAIGGSSSSTSANIFNAGSGTIAGTGGTAVRLYYGTFTNAGTVTGTVDMGFGYPYYAGASPRSYASSTFVAAGGTVAGDLLFGNGSDLLLQTADMLGVSGVVDGGGGTDIYGRSLTSSGTLVLDAANIRNFEDALVQAVGTATVVTTTATGTFGGNLYTVGTGSVVNQAAIAGALTTQLPYSLSSPYTANPLFPSDQVLTSLINAGSVGGGIAAGVSSFTNSGTVDSSVPYSSSVSLYGNTTLAFTNTGTINLADGSTYQPAVSLSATSGITVSNTGRIDGGGLYATLHPRTDGAPTSLIAANSGTITRSNGYNAAEFSIDASDSPNGGAVQINNSGTIAAQGSAATGGSASGFDLVLSNAAQPFTYALTNSGTISATADTSSGGSSRYATAATTLIVNGANLSGTITNVAGGTISATGDRAYAVVAAESPLVLVNAGTISATGTTDSYAISTFDAFANTIGNTGTIVGDVFLADGADTLDNAGMIRGAVTLGAGDDRFVQRVGGTVSGLVDGGDGVDSYTVDTTGGTTTLLASQIANFEQVTQTGTGTGAYSGTFGVDTIDLAGGTLSVAAGQTLATQNPTTVTGTAGSGNLLVNNAGTIADGIALADGNDIVANTGTIAGPVRLGGGDDSYVEGVGSVASGGVDGGAGVNLYRVVLAGDRTGIGARTNFQNLAVDGAGTLALMLDQGFQSIALNGTGLSLALGGFSVGQIVATGPATRLTLDGDVGSVQLGAGNDTLATGAARLEGRYDGGAGADTLRLTSGGAVTLSGVVTGFETLELAGSPLTITGTLGSAGQPLIFAAGDKSVAVARGGVLAGTVDLGAGNDSFRLAAGGMLAGSVSGGAGSNAATLDLSAGDLTLRANTLADFQQLATEGAGTLTLVGGSFAYDALSAAGNLTVGADASLAARVAFGPADNRLVMAGGFAGSVDGGGGTDSIDVSGGSAAVPVAFTSIGNVEAFRMSGGFATVSGAASPGSVALTGGRLVGLAGSTLTGSFAVGQGATFGSAGTVNGNVAVAGTLSPGASPGTMTVNGNVSLAATSVSVFEITPTVSDKLVVNGAVSIANGATLQLLPSGALTPGRSLDLVTATGGITGSFTNVVKPASLFGFVVQDASSIRLLGQFLNDTGYSGQVQNSIGYVNSVLTGGRSSAALIAAAPLLVTSTGATNASAFAQLSPEPYAAARQIGVENALTLADAGRGGAFAPTRDTPGVFTFASALSGTRTLEADTARGTARTTTNGYGFLGGIGIAGTGWSVGAFGGYLNDRQTLAGLGARTKADGAVAGVHGRVRYRGVGIKATVAYDGARADTRRTLPGGSAAGRYDLHSWIADASFDAAVPLSGGWEVRPSIGGTAIRTTRDGVTETGGSAFALAVAGRRSTAAFVDGGVTFAGSMTAGNAAAVRPYLTIGARYQAQGRTPYALAGLGGGDLGLLATGAARAPVLATATLGADVALSPRLALFGALSGESGDADHRAAARAGLRLAF